MSAETVDMATGEIIPAASPTPYQLLPRLSDDEYQALKADVREHGIRVPIDVDETGTILDGHHRAWIAADLGVDCPRRVVSGLSDDEKRAHAIAANVYRRQLSREQRREMVARLREQGMSTRRIAEVAGVHHATVARDVEDVRPVADATPRTEESEPTPVTGADGKTYQPQTLDQRRHLAAKLREQGLSVAQIGDAMGVSKSTAQYLVAPRKNASTTSSPSDTPRKVARIRELAEQAWTSPQIARDLGLSEQWVRQLARDNSITIHADKVVGKTRRIDSVQVAAEIVTGLAELALPMRLVNFSEITPAQAAEWADSLTESIRALNRFAKQMKETAQ